MMATITEPKTLNRQSAIRRAVRDLASPVTSRRAFAVRTIGLLGSARQQAIVIRALRDDATEVRRSAAEVLGLRKHAEGVTALLRAATEDPVGEVREAALEAVDGLLPRGFRPKVCGVALRALADDPVPRVRGTAVSLVARHSGRRALKHFSSALEGESHWLVRGLLVSALGELRDQRALPLLLKALSDPDSSVRLDAIEAVKVLQNPKGIAGLIAALRDNDAEVRDAAAEALAQSDRWVDSPTQVLHTLRQRLSAPHQRVRLLAAGRLGRTLDARAVPWLVIALRDEASSVRASAGRALGVIGDDSVVPHLVELLRDRDARVRRAVVLALTWLGSPVSATPLLRALKDRSASVRAAAALGLAEVGEIGSCDALFALRADRQAEVRLDAALALARLGDRRAGPLLRRLMTSPDLKRVPSCDECGEGCRNLIRETLEELKQRLASAATS